MDSNTTISEDYRALNEALHASNDAYGTSSARHAPTVEQLAAGLGTIDILDYGCGKGLLARNMSFPIKEYDPAVVSKRQAPNPADLVICTDVLEHVEPEFIEAVLDDLKRVTKRFGFFTVATRPAKKVLADGRNAHILIRPAPWWLEQISQRFDVINYFSIGREGISMAQIGQECLFVVESKK